MTDYKSIRKIFNDQKCALISREPLLDLNKLEYICCCGTKEVITLAEFQGKGHCDNCNGPTLRMGLTFFFIKQQFENFNRELISTEYKGYKSKLEFKCVCGKNSITTYHLFIKNKHKKCGLCSRKQSDYNRRHDYNFIKTQFELHQCTLLSQEYLGNNSELKYVCKCKRITKTTYNLFMKSEHKQCILCTREHVAYNQRHDYDFISDEFKNAGCTLLSIEYIGNNIPLDYICECGLPSKITYADFKEGCRCKDCGILKRSNALRYDYNDIKNYFEQNGCILLSETYINSKSLLEYICICDNKSTITYDSFRNGSRCGCVKSKGETKLIEIFNILDLQYIPQHIYPNCKNINCLPFDFYIDNKFIVEFDGEQHFKSIKLFGGDVKFIKRIKYDYIKNMYCIQNNIPILRISYKEIDKMELIISMYMALIDKNIVPPIIFTNKKLYQNMKNKITDVQKEHWFLEI